MLWSAHAPGLARHQLPIQTGHCELYVRVHLLAANHLLVLLLLVHLLLLHHLVVVHGGCTVLITARRVSELEVRGSTPPLRRIRLLVLMHRL